ncbi:discoidin domain-containing protein [Sphaerisporangium sp. TRM90804]|uniref:discoidin domain-containing protein n=1 Tax=Sphaerisporangium sp. TRM90804 TaxID=3031113 RepID=UPI002446E937|nr:discoidin domain-containing protein [Sphaerisporangium sp. TRM90804]MDH2427166.1 discoidin domain-containing protein [Sphaerisporangium sp. TRM90804]
MHPTRSPGRYRIGLLIASLVALVVPGLTVVSPAAAGTAPSSSGSASSAAAACGTANAAQGRPATASSSEGAGTPASAAFDGDTGTRWSSAFSDPQWIQVDLGSSQEICQVVLRWESAYGRAFQIQVSANGSTWTPVYTTTTGAGGVQTLAVSGTGRYVRMYGTARATGYGYSLWEFAVNTGSGTPSPACATDFGPNVSVFDPSMPAATIQARLNSVFAEMESNQFGQQRYALLFKPGTYNVGARVGYYTHVAGLGMSPDDVTINGPVMVDAGWFNGNATQNFWRAAENMALRPNEGYNRWAVSQAAPFRRMHVRSDMQLDDGGWSSGGFISDSKIDGQVRSGSQQQWLTRNSELGSWSGSVWNMVFTGVAGAPPPNFPNPSHTVVDQTPVSREKPFLYVNSAGAYNVFVPSLRQNTRGATWTSGQTPGSSLPLGDFCIARPGDTAAKLNAALASGKHLLFTPGVYHVDQPLRVTRPDTVVLGIGLATIIPDNGTMALSVADVDGVKIAGLLIDAGPVNTPVLVEVGPAGSSASHAANPTTLHDLFVRIGGAHVGKATTSVVVNSRNVIGDNLWLWRGDHGTGVGWTVNTADTGLVVNGSDVVMYGLFAEHYQKYQVIWNGERGRTYFFQNEMPYDPPNQASFMNGSTLGYAAYKVADSVTTHEAWGLGSYCLFLDDTSIVAERAFEVPNRSGVRLHNMVIVSLGGVGTIRHVVNNTGGPVNAASQTYYLTGYP